jgi:hypothetical protein
MVQTTCCAAAQKTARYALRSSAPEVADGFDLKTLTVHTSEDFLLYNHSANEDFQALAEELALELMPYINE